MSPDLSQLRIRSRQGNEIRCDCPFCDDKKGHLYVNVAKHVWHCVRCGVGGRISHEVLKENKYQRLWHPFDNKTEPPYPSPDRLHEVYTTLINTLSLSCNHRKHLYSPKRGMSPLQVTAGQYRTLPWGWETREYLGERIAETVNLEGIPGFYRSRRNDKWILAGYPGLLIPVRDWEGRIQGFQIRPDTQHGQKYLWLSSGHPQKHPGGRKVKAAFHVAGPRIQRVWITEGPLKADISAHFLKETVMAVPGVTMWKACGVVPELVRRDIKEVVIAYDSDAATNPNVARAARQLSNALRSLNLQVVQAHWEHYKGLDDLVLAGFEPELKKAI
jgi:DNA primase